MHSKAVNYPSSIITIKFIKSRRKMKRDEEKKRKKKERTCKYCDCNTYIYKIIAFTRGPAPVYVG